MTIKLELSQDQYELLTDILDFAILRSNGKPTVEEKQLLSYILYRCQKCGEPVQEEKMYGHSMVPSQCGECAS